ADRGRILDVPAHQHAEGDLRSAAVEREAERAVARAAHRHRLARLRPHLGEIAAIDPRGTAAQSLLSAGGDDDGWDHWQLQLSAVSYRLSAVSLATPIRG